MYDNTCKCQFGSTFYPFAVQPNEAHDFTLFAEMPLTQRLFFFSEDPEEYVKMSFFFNRPLKLRVYVGENLVFDPQLELDSSPDETVAAHGAHFQDPQARRSLGQAPSDDPAYPFEVLLRGAPGGSGAAPANTRASFNKQTRVLTLSDSADGGGC